MLKNSAAIHAFIFSSLVMSIPAFAQTLPASATSAATGSIPCSSLMDLCKTAGYTPTSADKNVFTHCIAPLVSGQTIANINATPMQIQTCRTDLAGMPCSNIITQCRAAGFTGGAGKLTLFDCVFPIARGKKTIAGITATPDEVKICQDTITKQFQTTPCLKVMIACTDAGYSPDSVNGEAFARNCYGPTLDGQKVPGVSIDDASVKACAKQSPSGTRPAPSM